MEEGGGPRLIDLLDSVQFVSAHPLDFARTDHDTTMAKVRLIETVAHHLNAISIAEFGGHGEVGEREPGLVAQVVGAAFQTFGGFDPHPGAFDKAAMLLRGITQGHPFNDANKRTGFLVAAYLLKMMGRLPPDRLPVDDSVDLCLAISAGAIRDVDVITQRLQDLWDPRRLQNPWDG